MTPISELIEAPLSTAIDVATLKLHLRIDNDEENLILETLINAATERVEEYISMKLIKQKWAIYWDNYNTKKKNEPWWDGTREMAIGELYGSSDKIDLPFGKVLGSDYAFATSDANSTFTDFAQANYQVDGISKQTRIALKSGNVWPSTDASMNGIRFLAYFGFSDDPKRVPNAIKQAMLIFCAAMYENKGDDALEIPMPATSLLLLAPWRSVRLG